MAPQVVEYMDEPLDVKSLRRICSKLGIGPKELLRQREPEYAQLGLADASDDAALEAMAAHPRLMERPIVVSGECAAIGRPPENILGIL